MRTVESSVVHYGDTVATYLNLLTTNGLALRQIEEWGPTDAQLTADPPLAAERDRPTFLLIRADKP